VDFVHPRSVTFEFPESLRLNRIYFAVRKAVLRNGNPGGNLRQITVSHKVKRQYVPVIRSRVSHGVANLIRY
jgi:hypothetical protein